MNLVYNMVVDLFNNARTNTLEVKKGNINSVQMRFTILNNGNPFDMSDVVMASVKGVKPDDSIIYAACDIEKDEEEKPINIVTYTLSDEATCVSGRTTYELSLADGDGNLVQSFDFYIYVVSNLFDESDQWGKSDVSAVASYMGRTLKAASDTEGLVATFIVAYGQIEEVLNRLQNEYDYYVDYINDLQERVARGDFNGARGPQGENGADAIVTESEGIMAFQIVDDELVVYFYGDDAPPLSIDDDGNLVYTY